LIYAVDNLEAARAEQARSQAALNKVREENLRKQRIPIELGTTLDQALQAMAATLKAAKDKVLTVELINNIFEDFRAIPAKLKW
jgi:bifunctional DNase/RNase